MLHLYQPKLVLDLYFALNSFHEVLLTSEKSHSLISKTILDCAFWDPENFEMTRKLCTFYYVRYFTLLMWQSHSMRLPIKSSEMRWNESLINVQVRPLCWVNWNISVFLCTLLYHVLRLKVCTSRVCPSKWVCLNNCVNGCVEVCSCIRFWN